jgi:hypothetical protein
MGEPMHVYVNNEAGPDCTCGNPTVVKLVDGGAGLLCLFHTYEAGAFSRLPVMTEEQWLAALSDEGGDDI